MILAHIVWRCVLMILIWDFNCDDEWRLYWYCDDTLTGSTSGWWQRNAAYSRREHKRSDYHDWGKSGCHDHRGQQWTLNYDNAGWVKNALTFVYEEERCIQSSAIMKTKTQQLIIDLDAQSSEFSRSHFKMGQCIMGQLGSLSKTFWQILSVKGVPPPALPP